MKSDSIALFILGGIMSIGTLASSVSHLLKGHIEYGLCLLLVAVLFFLFTRYIYKKEIK